MCKESGYAATKRVIKLFYSLITNIMIHLKKILPIVMSSFLLVFVFSCNNSEITPTLPKVNKPLSSSADYSDPVTFSGSNSSATGEVYEILPGPSVVNPSMSPTPFSDNIKKTTGIYNLVVEDNVDTDSPASTDAVTSVNIEFTANDGNRYKIDKINIIHKPDGVGDHTFFGGVGLNKVMHGNTGIGTPLMPKMLAYITLWGIADLKNAETGEVVAANRIVHLMTASRVRNKNLQLIPDVDMDKSDKDTWMAETHVILIPFDMDGNMSPVPGTDHGFIHMMWEQVNLNTATRDWKKVYEILPGPSAINPAMSPTPFSNKVAFGAGFYNLSVIDETDEDDPSSADRVNNVSIQYQRTNGETFVIDNIEVIHKEAGTGDHAYFGGVGTMKTMHGNTGIGTPLMPKLLSYITLWGKADLKDGNGNILAADRLIHIMVASRSRTEDLKLITDVLNDVTDHSKDKVETHIILPPLDMEGNMSPVPGTGHGFLHLMFENVELALN